MNGQFTLFAINLNPSVADDPAQDVEEKAAVPHGFQPDDGTQEHF